MGILLLLLAWFAIGYVSTLIAALLIKIFCKETIEFGEVLFLSCCGLVATITYICIGLFMLLIVLPYEFFIGGEKK